MQYTKVTETHFHCRLGLLYSQSYWPTTCRRKMSHTFNLAVLMRAMQYAGSSVSLCSHFCLSSSEGFTY